MKKILSFTLIFFCLLAAACENNDGGQDANGGLEMGLEIKITVGDNEFAAVLYDNETAQALADLLPMTINMNELNNNEKYYYLPNNLPTLPVNPGTIQAGDIMLYGANCLVVFYKSFSTSYSYTKIGKIESAEGFEAAVGDGNITITFSK